MSQSLTVDVFHSEEITALRGLLGREEFERARHTGVAPLTADTIATLNSEELTALRGLVGTVAFDQARRDGVVFSVP